MKNAEDEKKIVGFYAAEKIKEGSIVGIGTGSTVWYFIERLAERVQEGLHITATCSSIDSERKARERGIPVIDLEEVLSIDITVDGADEIDGDFSMIKGGGGALFREKLLATNSKEVIIIIDSSKKVPSLGKHPLPIEISPYAHKATIQKINALDLTGNLRLDKAKHRHYITDNGNLIYDINLQGPVADIKALHHTLKCIPGVIETGLFFSVATEVIVPSSTGNGVTFL